MFPRRLAELPSGRVTKWITLGIWIVLAAVLFPLANKLNSVTSNDASTFLPRSAEATVALDRAQHAFPSVEQARRRRRVRPRLRADAADTAKVESDRAVFATFADGGQVSPPIPDGRRHRAARDVPDRGRQQSADRPIDKVLDQLTVGAPAGAAGRADRISRRGQGHHRRVQRPRFHAAVRHRGRRRAVAAHHVPQPVPLDRAPAQRRHRRPAPRPLPSTCSRRRT